MSARLNVSIDSEEYSMSSWPRGICLIFNIEQFHPRQKLAPRPGSAKDSHDFKQCFRELGFITKEHKDEQCTYDNIMRALHKLANDDHSDYDCVVVAIMTHGDKNGLRAYDRRFSAEYFFKPFHKCPSLYGKPKLFFIQACRGTLLDSGHLVNSDAQDVVDSSSSEIRIPSWADYLVVNSTVDGYYSWRNPNSGSAFIQSLVSLLTSDESEHSDLLSILISVNRKVAYDFMSWTPHNDEFHEKKQIPSITCMLTRKIFLRRPDHCEYINDSEAEPLTDNGCFVKLFRRLSSFLDSDEHSREIPVKKTDSQYAQ